MSEKLPRALNPAPLHVRFIGEDENDPSNVQVFVHGKLSAEVDNFTLGDFARLFADVYGMPITMDRVSAKPRPPAVTVLTGDHLTKDAILFDASGYAGDVHMMHASTALGRAVNFKIVEAAKKLGVPIDSLHRAIRIVDHPEYLGSERKFVVQRMVNPAWAEFIGTVAWVPESSKHFMQFSGISVHMGEFGKAEGIDRVIQSGDY